MLAAQKQVGAVLAEGARFWIVWGTDGKSPLCIPLANRRKPQSRWDFPIRNADLPGLVGNCIVAAGDQAARPDCSKMVLVGHMAPAALAAMRRAMQRAAESVAVETRNSVPA